MFLKTQSLLLSLSFSLIKSSLSHPAGPWRNWEAADQEVHWRKEGLREIDRAEGWACVCGEVHFVGVGARGCIHLIQAWWAELEDRNKTFKKRPLRTPLSNTLSLYAYLHVLFTHSDSLTALWRISLEAVAVIRPWWWGQHEDTWVYLPNWGQSRVTVSSNQTRIHSKLFIN